MKRTLPIIALLACCAGCRTPVPADVSRSDIRVQIGTNVFSIAQPKETTWKHFEATDGIHRVVIDDYQSVVNAAAIEATKAQAQAQAETARAGFQTAERAFELGVKAAAKAVVP